MAAALGWWIVALALTTAMTATAQERPTAQRLLPHDVNFCFARTYDAAHLARNPKQQIVELRLGARAGWNVHGQRDLPYHDIIVALDVRTRAGAKPNLVLGSCSDYEESNEPGAERGLHCELVCNGDRLVVDALDANTIVVRNRGLRTSCERAPIGGKADAVFHLRRQALAVCAELPTLPAGEEAIQAALTKAREKR